MNHSDVLDIKRIKKTRESLHLSQEQAARLAGFKGKQQWNSIETGRTTNITLDTLVRIANALKCDPRELIRTPKRK